ncbi:MAG: DNRLRE domain-containing protein [Polyangiaceae bacterium]
MKRLMVALAARTVPLLLLATVAIAALGCTNRPVPCVGPESCNRGSTCAAGRCFKAGAELVPLDSQRIVVAADEVAVVARGNGDKALPGEIPLGGGPHPSAVVLLRFPTPWGKKVRVARAFVTLEPAPGAVAESQPVLVSIARVLEPWSAQDASWGRLPRTSAVEGAAYSSIGPAKPLRIDVTAIVQRWALARSADQGLAITASSDAPFGASYATGAAGSTGPRLDVYLR